MKTLSMQAQPTWNMYCAVQQNELCQVNPNNKLLHGQSKYFVLK